MEIGEKKDEKESLIKWEQSEKKSARNELSNVQYKKYNKNQKD